eukprot:10068406-Alexandrium_andersonii.AAC.1
MAASETPRSRRARSCSASASGDQPARASAAHAVRTAASDGGARGRTLASRASVSGGKTDNRGTGALAAADQVKAAAAPRSGAAAKSRA